MDKTKDWETALEKFVNKWRNDGKIRAILLTGSYAVGFQSIHSDIDIHLINYEEEGWRERGNLRLDGFLIEYFINPVSEHYGYVENDINRNSYTNARMFATGKPILDKDGCLVELIEYSRNIMQKPFREQSNSWIETEKYAMWDHLDNLKDDERLSNENFRHSYHIMLRSILKTYCVFLRAEIPPDVRIVDYFTNEKFRKAYVYKEFPDRKFSGLFMKCLREESIGNIKELVRHTQSAMGAFEIDGWKLKSSLTGNPD